MKEKINILIKCPFYLFMRNTMMACEGLNGDACMTTKFPSVVSMMEHIDNCCSKANGGKCPLAMKLYEKYDRMEEERVKQAIDRARKMQLLASDRSEAGSLK